MDNAKDKHIGLPLLMGGTLATAGLPFGIYKKAAIAPLIHGAKSGNRPPAFTNLGALDPVALDFESVSLKSARIVVPAAAPPFFVCGVSGFKGAMTLSAGVSAIPLPQVEELFSLVDDQLP